MQYVLGLDIGIASVGWAVLNLDRTRIEDLGVRMFDTAEQPKTGASLAEPRRLARGTRRRLRRRAGRLRRVKELLAASGLIPAGDERVFCTAADKPDPWQLRVDGLDRVLSGEELARALFHLAKRRGFKSNRKTVGTSKKDAEDGKVLSLIKANRELLAERGYRTAGEMYCKDPRFHERKRNSTNQYDHSVDRAMLEEEIAILFDRQRTLGSVYASPTLEAQLLDCFRWQLPFASGDAILDKVGYCTFERTEKRAPRMAYTNERCRLLQDVNKLSYADAQATHRLNDAQRAAVCDLVYAKATKSTPKVTYADLRKALKIPASAHFVGLSYSRDEEKNATLEGKSTFAVLHGYHHLYQAFHAAGLWSALVDDAALQDALAFALTFYKAEADLRACLTAQGVRADLIDVAANMPAFDKVAHLSLTAMRKLLPHLEAGEIYSEACTKAGYDHRALGTRERQPLLPLIDTEEIRNPVVLRALTQARKVVNAIIRRYGAPTRIHIEFARDMSRNFDERLKILRGQKERESMRRGALEHFLELFPCCPRPTYEDRLKLQLYREQDGKCAYAQEPLDLNRLLEPGYVQVDHILPYSRSFDDGQANKILVRAAENQRKKNATPFEYFGHDATRWAAFEAWVYATIRDRKKQRNLLMRDFDEEKAKEWKDRNLNDTRYIARYFADFVRETLQFADPKEKLPVRCVNGQVTALVRGLWGLTKNREENDLHHALDAAVVATLLPWQIARITAYRKACELQAASVTDDMFIDPETGEVMEVQKGRHFTLPKPWPNFRGELLARLSACPAALLAPLGLTTYDDLAEIRPIFVSRAPRRKMTGAMHQETIKTAKLLHDGRTVIRKPLTALKLADLARAVAPETNARLYAAIRERLEAYGDNGQKAFGDHPLRKPTNDGSPGPVVKGVKLYDTQKSGVPVRGGIADNDSMVRVDVFTKDDQFYMVPVYVADVMTGRLPQKAITSGKAEAEWPVIDDNYRFLFSLCQYDLIRIVLKDKAYFGYYKGVDRSAGVLKLCEPNKGDSMDRPGVKTALSIEKYVVDVLGHYYPVKKEVRRGLESHCDQQPGLPADCR